MNFVSGAGIYTPTVSYNSNLKINDKISESDNPQRILLTNQLGTTFWVGFLVCLSSSKALEIAQKSRLDSMIGGPG